MSTQLTKIVHASALVENFGLTESLFARANEKSYINPADFQFVKSEHDLEGIYSISKIGYREAFESAVIHFKNELAYLVRFDTDMPQFDIDSVSKRKTLDGKKFYKAVNAYIKRVERMAESHEEAGRIKMWIDDARRALKRLEEQDQKGGYFEKVKNEMFVRLSFRTQDVAGMTALGRFGSCQDIVANGWDCNSVGVLGSLLSPAIGTVSLFETLDGALSRDRYDEVYEQDSHIARITIAQDINGSVHIGSKTYYRDNEAYTFIRLFVDEMLKAGKTVEAHEMDTIQIQENEVELEKRVDYYYRGHVDVEASFTSYTESELLETVNEVLEAHEIDEQDDLDEAMELVTEMGLTDEVHTELMGLVDVNEMEASEGVELDDTDDYGYTYWMESDTVSEYLDLSDVQEAVEEELNQMDVDDVIEYLQSGYMTVSQYVDIDIDETMETWETARPYLEESVDTLDYECI
jgi:hypothetical protein